MTTPTDADDDATTGDPGLETAAGDATTASAGRAATDRAPVDPVRVQRARIQAALKKVQRVGYLLYAVAIVAVMVAVFSGFPAGLLRVATWTLLAGSFVLAPAIIGLYTVKAAERDDRERGL